MELSQIGSHMDVIMSSVPAAAPVYNATTIPLSDSSNGKSSGRNSQSTTGADEKFELKSFSNLPERTPVDIQFKDISYTVKAGFRKGEWEGQIKRLIKRAKECEWKTYQIY